MANLLECKQKAFEKGKNTPYEKWFENQVNGLARIGTKHKSK